MRGMITFGMSRKNFTAEALKECAMQHAAAQFLIVAV
jgi:hypothetical protein